MTPDLLDRAVARGIISAAQRDALHALERETSPGAGAPSGEAPRALNAVSVAYYAGAAIVLFAFAWFLVERWTRLGAAGVLIVALVYAALFTLTARVLLARGFRTASAIATVLVVGMTPLVGWALLTLAGWFPDVPPVVGGHARRDPWEGARWMPVELATLGAALVAIRRVRFSLLALPAGVSLWFFVVSLGATVVDPDLRRFLGERLWLVVSAALLLAAHVTERRAGRREDYAFWLHLLAVAALLMATVDGLLRSDPERHALPLISIGATALALHLRRRAWLVAAAVTGLCYVGWLASEVFRDSAAFPVVLATLGLLVILGAVFAQRRFPFLTRGFDGDVETRPLPGGQLITVGLLAIAIALTAAEIPEARQRQREEDAQRRFQARRAARDRAPLGRPAPDGETAPGRRP